MNILDEQCFIENDKITSGGVRSEYDFLYLPIDFRLPFYLCVLIIFSSSNNGICDLVRCPLWSRVSSIFAVWM